MQRAVKWSIGGITAIVVLALVLIITVVVIMNTATGSRWAIGRISAVIPGSLQAGDFEGTLWQGLRFPTLVYRDDDREIEATELALSFDWSTLAAGRLTLDGLDAKTVEQREMGAAEPVPKPLEVSMEALPIDIAIRRVAVGEFAFGDDSKTTSYFDIAIDNVRIDGNTIRARNVSASTADIAVSAAGFSMTLQGDVPLSANIRWNLADGSWSGFGALSDSLAELSFEQTVAGPQPGRVSGSVRLLNRIEPEFDVQINWESWSFSEYELIDGKARIKGLVGRYSAAYDLAVLLPGGQQYQVTGTADGDTEKLFAFTAQVDGLAGLAELSGSLAWSPAFMAEAEVTASQIDPAVFVKELSGKLDAAASITIDDAGAVKVAGLTVTGDLNEAPVQATGSLLLAPQRMQCEICSLSVGRNTLRFDGGSTDDQIAVSLSIDAPDLAELWPDLSGTASGNGKLAGSFNSPRFTGALTARQVAFRDWSALSIDITSRESALETFDLSATVESVFNGDIDLGALTVAGRGQIAGLEFDADWNVRGLNISAAGAVRRVDEDINGVIRTAKITEPNTGDWLLADAFAFQWSETALSVEPHVWSGTSGAVRVSQFAVADDEVNIVAGLAGLPLQIANSFLPENLQLLGFATADVDLTQRAGQWNGSIDWRQSDTILRVAEFNDQITDIVIPSAALEARLSDGGVVAKATISIEPGVSGELDFELANLAVDSPMTGELRLQGDSWGWISAVVPQVDGFEGSINASVSADGPLAAPEFSGSVAWRNGRLLLPALNVPLDNIDLVISGASRGTATLAASAKAGDGTLGVTGQFDNLMRPTRSVTLQLTGNAAEMINWPEYHLWATPDLVVIGSAAGWQISGEVTVPRADITFREIPVEAVTISPDVVVLGEEELAVAATRYSGRARLLLGERVRFNAMGLDTGLSGDLLLRMPENRPLRAEGQVSLVDGIFAAYGQKLAISEGNLTFTGPLDDPIVDVKAVRVIETFDGTVTAGIHLRGRAQNLTSSVFADPKMADADALSYLVIGRPLNQATQTEGGELSGAAVALGLRQATRLTEQIGQAVGLDQLSLTGDGGDTTALVAGKQINSRLYARYAYGVFSRLGTLVLRYKLSRRVALEAGAGETQSIDILYSVEKD